MQNPEAAIAALAFASIALGVLVTRARTAPTTRADKRPELGGRVVLGLAVGIALALILALAPVHSSLADGVVILVIMWCAAHLAGRRTTSPIPPAVAARRKSRGAGFLEELGRAAMTCGIRNGVPWIVHEQDLRRPDPDRASR